jgi:hypothetical protein
VPLGVLDMDTFTRRANTFGGGVMDGAAAERLA